MKKQSILLISLFFSCFTSLVAQQMSLGFVKNCLTYKRTVYADEMKQKHFLPVQDKVENTANPLLSGATYYSNSNKENVAPGEIKVLSLITDKIKITEITFSKEYLNNYNEVFKQMVNFFKNQQSFKNEKYKTDVAKFSKDDVYYYAYKNGETQVI
ncbi:MAG TPA: hypothetical protein VFF27_11650, partial [Bacteroidia bacterium]|nr:hypothetical protein [Bacteroidia bacterium]